MAYKIPSMKRNRPNAMINSFIKIGYSDLGFIFPKNLKNSLSGDKINAPIVAIPIPLKRFPDKEKFKIIPKVNYYF